MFRGSAIFVAACMVLICGSFGAVLYLAFGIPIVGALVCAIVALSGGAACTIVASRPAGGGRSNQLGDLSRGVTELAGQVIELGRRVAAMEGKVADALERTEARTQPLAAEIGEIGGILKQLAESISVHDVMLQNGGAFGAASPPVAPSSGPAFPARPAHMMAPPAAPPEATAAATQPAPAPPALLARRDEPIDDEPDVPADGFFKGMSPDVALGIIREAIEANRIEFYLQPIMTLPQRKVRYYEALARLRTADGDMLTPREFLPFAEAGGLMPRIDSIMLLRCVQVVRRLMSKNRDVGLFCNISASTLVDAAFFEQFTEFMDANRAIAPALIFEITQAAYRAMGPIESESLGAMMGCGFRFSMDHVGDLKLEPRDLADRGFRFIKVPATLLLNRIGSSAGDIHPADLSGLLLRFGIELIAERIESEGTVVDLLDFDVKYGQGYLFSQPRPVRAEVLQGIADRSGDVRQPATMTEEPRRPAKDAAAPSGSVDPRLQALQRPTALAQIARAVVARSAAGG